MARCELRQLRRLNVCRGAGRPNPLSRPCGLWLLLASRPDPLCLIYDFGMPTTILERSELTVAVQDYAKAIYALESRAGVASTTALAERLGVRPASVSGMLLKLD